MTDLYAFIYGQLAGLFRQTGPRSATFEYCPGYDGTPLSLSLLPGRPHTRSAPFNYLDNLLPEHPAKRERLAARYGTSTDIFNLLARLGEDVAGATALSTDEHMPQRELQPVVEATEDDIAYMIAILRRDPTAPPPNWAETRWSLAGLQGKFSLARDNGKWLWSSFETPSTHIFKPEWEQAKRAEVAELACLTLASQTGLPATVGRVLRFKGESVLVLQRWDRSGYDRIHAEDMVQALGLSPSRKYDVRPQDIVQRLRDAGQEWEFVRQLLFNMAIGNADAHAKNYSVLHTSQSTVMAPVYDTLPIFLWPGFDQKLAMPINGKRWLADISEADWRALAQSCDLDADELMTKMREIFSFVAQRLPDALSGDGFNPGDKDLAAKFVSHHLNRHLRHREQ